MELFKTAAQIDVTMISYKGAGPAMADLMAGQVDVMFATVPTVASLLKSNKLVALAITSPQRSDVAPGLPAMAEFYPGFRTEVWVGMFAPAKTPQDVIGRVNAEAVKVLAMADTRARFAEQGMETVGSTPAQLQEWLRNEMERWGKVIRENKITLE